MFMICQAIGKVSRKADPKIDSWSIQTTVDNNESVKRKMETAVIFSEVGKKKEKNNFYINEIRKRQH